MKNKVYIKKKKLIIEVPLKQERFALFGEYAREGENIIGIIEPRANCDFPQIGFAYRIDMSYKGKADQWTEIFYNWDGDEEDFKKFCEDNNIEYFIYSQCHVCKNPIFGCFTIDNTGFVCSDCERKKEKE